MRIGQGIGNLDADPCHPLGEAVLGLGKRGDARLGPWARRRRFRRLGFGPGAFRSHVGRRQRAAEAGRPVAIALVANRPMASELARSAASRPLGVWRSVPCPAASCEGAVRNCLSSSRMTSSPCPSMNCMT